MKLTSPPFILLVLVASLAGIYLTQLWWVGDAAHLAMSSLFFLAVTSFVRDNQTSLRFKSV